MILFYMFYMDIIEIKLERDKWEMLRILSAKSANKEI